MIQVGNFIFFCFRLINSIYLLLMIEIFCSVAGMHCLGAVTGGIPSPNGAGGRGGILSVFRALGVLVCEGRIQGPPRGYKEGPHCAAPMQTVPNDHVCEENNYLVMQTF